MKHAVLSLSLALFALPTMVFAQDAGGNITEGCVETYDASVNYFPDQAVVEYASGFQVEYFNHYKVVTVSEPWLGAEQDFSYVLVQCGTPAPETVENAVVIEVPIQSIAVMSTTYLSHLVQLGLVESLVALDETDFAYAPEVREAIDAGQVVEIGSGPTLNVELALDLEPDLTMTYGIGSPEYDVHPTLTDAGLDVVLNGDYMETDPLGRAEWIKFTSLFFNREAEANALFSEVATAYHDLSELAVTVEDRPLVLNNAPYAGTWYLSGGESFAVQLISDAGGEYILSDNTSTGSVALSFEEVVDIASEADIWINPSFWYTLSDGLAEDERYIDFAAFENGQLYNNNLRVNEFFGNDYDESGVTRPDLVLADLIAIFHPDLLPNHEFVYYRQLPE